MAAVTIDTFRAADPGLGGPVPVPTTGPSAADRSLAAARPGRSVRSWLLLVLAAPAAAEVFSRGRPLQQMSGPHVWPAQRLVMAKLQGVTGVVQVHYRRVVAAWARLGSRSWTFDQLTCGFTPQVDEICALARLDSSWTGSPGFELESPARGTSAPGGQAVTRALQPCREIPVELMSGGVLARMRPDLSIGAALPRWAVTSG